MAGRILNRYKRHCKAADAILIAEGIRIQARRKARDGPLKWQGGHKMKIQYTSYGVTVWTDSGRPYTAATEEEAREAAEEDSGKE